MFRTNENSGPYSHQTRVAEVFTPSAPIDSMALFRGRSTQIQMLVEAVSQIGQHAIVYGERGVGKTSMANVLYKGRPVISSETSF